MFTSVLCVLAITGYYAVITIVIIKKKKKDYLKIYGNGFLLECKENMKNCRVPQTKILGAYTPFHIIFE